VIHLSVSAVSMPVLLVKKTRQFMMLLRRLLGQPHHRQDNQRQVSDPGCGRTLG
jgi:hypothetical protein